MMLFDTKKETVTSHLKDLIQLSYRLGATNAGIISPMDISVEDDLVSFCREPRCENYGLSPSCPPHVAGPSGFRSLLKTAKHAIVIRIVVPSAVLFSNERREVMALLHEIVAGIEQAAVRMGYADAKAFAGGSCKNIFCHEHANCRRLSKKGDCRNPQHARPSMSGFGINVSKLMKAAGWSGVINSPAADSDTESMSWVTGLIVI
jgi:predicted metal-binding protein